MSTNSLPEHFTEDYKQNWLQRIQQFPSLLAGAVLDDTIDGHIARYSFLEAQEMDDINVRHGVTQRKDQGTFIRWMRSEKKTLANLLDEWDDKELGRQLSPKGGIIMGHGFAYNRKKDLQIIKGMEDPAITGEDQATLVPLPASQRVAVSFNPGGAPTDSGLTFPKIAEARFIFKNAPLELDRTNAFAVISPATDKDLVTNIEEARNKDFASTKIIGEGTVAGEYWMGFNWIVSTLLTDNPAAVGAGGPVTATNCLFWHKDYVYFGDGEKRSNVDILPAESHAVQCRTRARMGGMRREEKGVVLVETLVP